MPIYEFYSPDTNKVYSFFARSSRFATALPRCPDGAELRMQKLVSGFAIVGRAKEPAEPAGPGEDLSPQQEAEMMRLASEMEGLDEENPDPKALGHLMRRMTEIAGENVPEDMNEMLRRLEAGEDLEKLEEEYGDLMGDGGDDEDGMMPPGAGADVEPSADLRKTMRRLRNRPRRDPALYEMNDYLDSTQSLDPAQAISPPAQPGSVPSPITHVVVFWADEPRETNTARILEGAATLARIPGVMEYRHGKAVPSPRGAVDDSFAVAISMTFADGAAMDAYRTHPIHVEFVENVMKPLATRFVAYDFAP